MVQPAVRVVDYMITGICNLSCPFCYGPDPNVADSLSLSEAVSLFGFLYQQGVEGVVIAGGEPTLSPILGDVLATLQRKNLWTAVQTNCTRPRVLVPYLSTLSWLALPLDSVTELGGLALRSSRGHLKTILRLARREEVASARRAGMRLKIGTVLTPQNRDELQLIAEVVTSLSPDVWKIHQFRPRGAGRANQNWLSLDSEDFDSATTAIMSQFPHLNITISPAEESVTSYLIINPDSTLLVPKLDRYLSYGRLLAQDGAVNQTVWHSALRDLDLFAHTRNVMQSFPEDNPYGGRDHSFKPGNAVSTRIEGGVEPTEVIDRDGC